MLPALKSDMRRVMDTTTIPTSKLDTTRPSVPLRQAGAGIRHPWLAAYAALLALGAWAGAVGLATGFLALPHTRVIAEARRLEDVNDAFEEVLAGRVPARLVFDMT